MRPKIITADMLIEMRALRGEGMGYREIGDQYNVSAMTAYYNIIGSRSPTRCSTNPPPAANDNKIIKMMPHNGGCSTTSGDMPVSLRRVPTLDAAEVAPSARELQRAAELQVAA